MSLLLDYLPPFFAEIAEIRAIFAAVQTELALLNLEIERAKANLHVATADESGLRRIAGSLRLRNTYSEMENLRFELRTVLLTCRPYTFAMLQNALTELCGTDGYRLERDLSDKKLTVTTVNLNENQRESLRRFLDRVAPADMVITVKEEGDADG